MHRLTETLKTLSKDTTLRKRLYAVTLAAALVILVIAVKGPEEQGHMVTDENGFVTGIKRHSLHTAERYDVTVIVGKGTDAEEKNVTIGLRSITGTKTAGINAADDTDLRNAEIDAEIDRMLTEIEYSDEKTVVLPDELSDGTPVAWKVRKQTDRTGIVYIPFIYIAVVLAAIKSAVDKDSDAEKTARKEILRGLPRFCNQLFLMMNAGLILSDAFRTICMIYMRYGEDTMSVFERELTALIRENEDSRISTASLITEYASRHNVKELVRIATILTENERRGSDVIENLSRESQYLWDERKIIARESGRMIDMKMSWPLGMLLILLIVITMAPAMLNM